MRSRQYITLGGILFVTFLFYYTSGLFSPARPSAKNAIRPPAYIPPPPTVFEEPPARPPPSGTPRPAPNGSHPIWYLINEAQHDFDAVKARQSKTLSEAVTEYRRRYGMPPPPNFDKWFAFAKQNDVQMIDEFDTVYDMITPFWGLKPATIRARAREALGYGNSLLGVQIRGQQLTHIDGGGQWMRTAFQGMLDTAAPFLPDIDLCFNTHDEPRVIVPSEDMARLVNKGRRINMAAALGRAPDTLRNSFSRAEELNDGTRFEEVPTTRFNVFPHQPTWTHSRMSCPVDSPARALEEDSRKDEMGRYGLGELGFIYNVTAMSDICYTPSIAERHGFFYGPNAFNVVHDLFPIFSQSKMSSYSDLIFPSPWYWFDKVPYDAEKDMAWDKKQEIFYWRGSTTGGFSRDGGWRHQHRQRFVKKINANDQARILVNKGDPHDQHWEVREVPRGDLRDIIDVHFTHIGQCDAGDCAAQREEFELKPKVAQQEAWRYKYLLDVDGNAFSGRFYAFLRSRSLVYKWAVFREWHFEWLKPWVHYVPLSIQGEEWLESVRFFGEKPLGTREAEKMAMLGQDWANKVLRKVDMEAWFFRLLLEYARVVDDDREIIGFHA